MNKPILSSLNQQVTALAMSRTAVLTDQLYGVQYARKEKALKFSQQPPGNVDVLIVGKEHYSEENRSFPIQSSRELNKILSLESANSDNVMLYHVGPYDDGERKVICWHIKPQVFSDRQLKPLLVIPESALLLGGTQQQLFTVKRGDKTFWFIERKGQYLCAEKKGLLSNSSMFLASAGLSEQITHTEVDSNNYLELLLANFIEVIFKRFVGFQSRLRSMAEIDYKAHLKYSGISAAAILVGYFSLTSWYLDMRLASARADAQVYSEKTRDVFELKDQLNRVELKSKQVSEVTENVGAPNIVWRLIVPLVKRGVLISQVSMLPDGVFIVRAEADKATDILEFISSDPVVVEPQFRGQTSTVKVKGKDKERFAVAFKIKQGA